MLGNVEAGRLDPNMAKCFIFLLIHAYAHTEQYIVGLLEGCSTMEAVHVVQWRDFLCAPDTLAMTLALIFTKDTLLCTGVLGTALATLKDALDTQHQAAIDMAQRVIEAALPDLVEGYRKGAHIGVADLWAALCSVSMSPFALGAMAFARCACGLQSLRPCQLTNWCCDDIIGVSSAFSEMGTSLGSGDAVVNIPCTVEGLLHFRKASRTKMQVCTECNSMYSFDVELAPKQAMCVRVEVEYADHGVLDKIIPELSHITVNGHTFLLSALIVCKEHHYMSYFYAKGVSCLPQDGWYYYDGMAASGRVRSLGSSLQVDMRHARNIELLLYTRKR